MLWMKWLWISEGECFPGVVYCENEAIKEALYTQKNDCKVRHEVDGCFVESVTNIWDNL